jgi:hypothetical protein
MNVNDDNIVVASADTVPANKVRILRVGENPSDAYSPMIVDEESIGFDPYDTASLFVQKVVQKSAD